MKTKLIDILTVIISFLIVFIELIIDLFDKAWNWLKGLFGKKKPVAKNAKVEDATEEKVEQENYRCHECGKEFLAKKVIVRCDHRPLTGSVLEECPYCESVETMPVRVERDRYYEDEYRRLWKRTLFLRKLIS